MDYVCGVFIEIKYEAALVLFDYYKNTMLHFGPHLESLLVLCVWSSHNDLLNSIFTVALFKYFTGANAISYTITVRLIMLTYFRLQIYE